MPAVAHLEYGAPNELIINVTVTRSGIALELLVELQWFNKTATRLPEASFMSFTPLVPHPNSYHPPDSANSSTSGSGGWEMDVLGYPVSPMSVAANGTRHLHAVWDGVQYNDSTCKVEIRPTCCSTLMARSRT